MATLVTDLLDIAAGLEPLCLREGDVVTKEQAETLASVTAIIVKIVRAPPPPSIGAPSEPRIS